MAEVSTIFRRRKPGLVLSAKPTLWLLMTWQHNEPVHESYGSSPGIIQSFTGIDLVFHPLLNAAMAVVRWAPCDAVWAGPFVISAKWIMMPCIAPFYVDLHFWTPMTINCYGVNNCRSQTGSLIGDALTDNVNSLRLYDMYWWVN